MIKKHGEIKITYRELAEAGRKIDDADIDRVAHLCAEAEMAFQAIGFVVREKPSQYSDIQESHITFRDPIDVGYTPVEWVEKLARVVSIASNILEPNEEEEDWLNRIRANHDPEEFFAGLLYYQSMLSGLWGADDTCYDYHNSFVLTILDYIVEVIS